MNTTLKYTLGGFAALVAVAAITSPFIRDEEPAATVAAVAEPAPALATAAPLPTATPEPTATPQPTATPLPTAQPMSDEDLSILVFRTFTSDLESASSSNLSDAEVVEFAGYICELASLVDSREEFIILAVEANRDTGMSDTDAGTVMGAAIGAFCPDEGARIGIG